MDLGDLVVVSSQRRQIGDVSDEGFVLPEEHFGFAPPPRLSAIYRPELMECELGGRLGDISLPEAHAARLERSIHLRTW
jgi:hypothetical protein